MLEVFDNDRLTVNQVAKRLPVHVATVWRWVLHGVRGKRLNSHLVGGRRYIYGRDLLTFLAPTPVDQSAIDRNHRADLAGIELDRRRAQRIHRHAVPGKSTRDCGA